jgi:ubiquinone biosynthesis protein
MNLWANLERITHLFKVFGKHGWTYLVNVRLARWTWIAPYLPTDDVPGPERLRLLFEELGGTFVKLGQMLALQSDILPLEYCNALFKLLDRIDPFPFEGVEQTFQEQFGKAPDDIFDVFERTPLATASIGQVYIAYLDGQKLAVKVRRPSVESEFAGDIRLMATTLSIIRLFRFKRLYWMLEPLSEFINWTREELDYRFETRYMEQLRRNATDNTKEYIPYVVPDYSTDRVLTAEFLEGLTLLNYIRALESGDELLVRRMHSAGFDPDQFASNIVDNFLNDAFQHGMFHADLHPANLMILPDNVVGYIDFGITGVISPYLRHNLVALTLAYSRGDLDGMFSAFFRVSAFGPEVDVTAFRRGLQTLSNNWYVIRGHERKMLKNITLVMLDLLHLSRQTGVWPERDVIKYIRSSVAIDGLITRFAPGFDVPKYLEAVCNRYLKWHVRQQLVAYDTLVNWSSANSQLLNNGALRAAALLDTLGSPGTPVQRVVNWYAEANDDAARQVIQMATIVFVLALLLIVTNTRIQLGVNLFTAEVLLMVTAILNLLRHLWRLI